MESGSLHETFTFKDLVSVNYTILANRPLSSSAMAIVEITPTKDVEMVTNNSIIVPEELKEVKSQFRVLKHGQYLISIFRYCRKNIIWKIYGVGFDNISF